MREFGAPAMAFGMAIEGGAALSAEFLHWESMARAQANVK